MSFWLCSMCISFLLGIGRYALLSPQLHLYSICILLILLVRTCMLCLPYTNGGYRTLPSVIPSTLSPQSASLLVELPRHLEVSSLRLSSELLSAVLAFLSLLLVARAISSKSVLLLIQWMLSIECCLRALSGLHLPDSVCGCILLPMLTLPADLLHCSPICHLFIC